MEFAPTQTEEFAIEIPDEDADRITTVGEGALPHPTSSLPARSLRLTSDSLSAAVDYITKSPEAR